MQANYGYNKNKDTSDRIFTYAKMGKRHFSIVEGFACNIIDETHTKNRQAIEFIMNIDKEGLIYFASNAVLELFSKKAEEVIGKHIIAMNESVGLYDNSWFYEIFNDRFAKNVFELNNRWFVCKYEVKLDPDKAVEGIVVIGKEIKEDNKYKNHLLYSKYYDNLTKILNKKGLNERISNLKNIKKAVSFYIDIWGFTKISNYYGNKVSEEIIKAVAKELKEFIDEQCLIARVSNDRFVVLCLNGKACSSVIKNQLDRFREILVSTFTVNDIEITVDKRIGYAVYPDDTNQLNKLVSLSNLAMSESFKNGKIDIIKYDKCMSSKLETNIVLASKLKNAIRDHLIEVHFQKVVDANDNSVVQLEQLARWTDKDLGYISPPVFFQVAKESNLLDCLERYLIDKAFCAFEKFNKQYEGAKLAINITPCSLLDPKFVGFLNETAWRYNIEQKNICIEISESTFVNSVDLCIERINQYKGHNYKIALDDFGKEYSSLSILDRVAFDIIKIDAAFVNKISHFKNREIIKMIRRIAKISNKEIIAEGVETILQKETLQKLGCFLQQGFLFHKPEFMA